MIGATIYRTDSVIYWGDVPRLPLYMYMLSVFWGFWFCGWGVFGGVWVVVFLICFDRLCLVFGWWVFCFVCAGAWVSLGSSQALRLL